MFNSRKRMFALVKAWRASGRSMLAFATDHGFAHSTFRYWVLRFDQAHAPRPAEAFVEVTPPADFAPDEAAPAGLVEVCYPNGVRLRLRHPAPELLHALVHAEPVPPCSR